MSYTRGTINMPHLSSSMCSLLNEKVIKELDKLGIKTGTVEILYNNNYRIVMINIIIMISFHSY